MSRGLDRWRPLDFPFQKPLYYLYLNTCVCSLKANDVKLNNNNNNVSLVLVFLNILFQ